MHQNRLISPLVVYNRDSMINASLYISYTSRLYHQVSVSQQTGLCLTCLEILKTFFTVMGAHVIQISNV